MLVKEFFLDCIVNEESAVAHYLYHLLTEKKISYSDDMDKLDLNQADHKKVAEMIRNDVLGFHKIRIYSLKINQKDFVFIFAASEQEAIEYYAKTFQKTPLNCHEYSLDFQFIRGKEVISFWEMRKEFRSFPAIAGYFRR